MQEAGMSALWNTVHGWFTPWVLFLVLHLIVATIFVTSRATSSAGSGEDAPAGAVGERRSLSLVDSMAIDRPHFTAPAPEAPVTGVLDLGQPDEQPPPLQMEPEDQGEHDAFTKEGEHDEHTHMERSMSEAAVEAELPRLPTRLRKSASDKPAFAHFVAESDTKEVEARRQATRRDAERRRPLVAEPEEPASEVEIEEAGGEVDARADEFINKFHHQLKMQHMDSFMHSQKRLHRRRATVAPEASSAAAGAP
ncbi:hypothetical protein CFC21_098681 [Triticum aestivum]|uniref:DUF4408 domain-containing protein n=2 Tax=Triticum aestivum TaxID=4565 RepID=A0A3B6RI68_WHEAT|nr:uncharacterized protein LOC123151794 [Triticum aestivum]KAF7096784.1 hypothetical protein CFC21_098681 [Triticum aestivum]